MRSLVGVNLHDWIDELCDVLDVDAEIDEGLVLDLARVAAHQVARPAAPITAFVLGIAAATHAPDLDVEELAARAQRLAEAWDRPSGSPDPETAPDVDVPDDSAIDHSSDVGDLV